MARLFSFLLATVLAATPTASDTEPPHGTLAGGGHWSAEVPASWNGTLLLWSRGYSPVPGIPEAAPKDLKDELLNAGYAVAGSNYGSGGWALEEAVPAQLETIEAFSKRHGRPKRIIAWGYSMGGLVTTALAEQDPAPIDGAAAFCSSIGGAVGMMNMAFDGAYAFRTLLAPDSDIKVVGVDDDMANAKRVGSVLADAMSSPQGRARVALAGVLAGIPQWTKPGSPQPDSRDHAAQVDQIADAFVRGVYLPRVDQERRGGGPFSWNSGIDYRRQLAESGRMAFVEALYRTAALDLESDLRGLNAGATIEADPKAVDYLMRHYTPTGRPTVPLVAVQKIGDGLTSPSLQGGYTDAAKGDVQALWVAEAGHCGFEAEVALSALRYLEDRVEGGRWPTRPPGFVEHRPAPMLRPCIRGEYCR